MSILRRAQQISATTALDANLYQRRLLYLFTYLAAVTSLQILHLALDDLTLTLGLVGAVTAGFVYSFYVSPRLRAVTTYVISILAVGLSLYYAVQIYSKIAMYGNYLGVLLGILTALLAYKAFSPDDHRFILMVCVVFLLFSSVASYDLKFMLLLPLFLIFSGITLYIANQVDVTVRVTGTTGGRAEKGFSLGWGFIIILGRAIIGVIILSVIAYIVTPHSTQENRNLMLGQAPSVQDPVTPDGATNDALVAENDDRSAEVGISDEFDLLDGRKLVSNPDPVLQMKSHRAGYLRAQVYDIFTGSGWIKSPLLDTTLSGDEILRSLKAGELAMQPQSYKIKYVPLIDFPSFSYAGFLQEKHGIFFTPEHNSFSTFDVHQSEPGNLSYDIIRQEITLLDDQPPYYFAMYQPFRLENISETVSEKVLDIPLVDNGATLRPHTLDGIHPADFSYTVYSLEPRPRTKHLSEVYSTGPDELVERYTQLPEGTWDQEEDGRISGIPRHQFRPVSSWLNNYAGKFSQPLPDSDVEGPLSVYEKVLAIYRYLLSDEFTYDREFKAPTERVNRKVEITEAFVRETKSGYCRYFASAMAVLCRINGIPSRVVTGYSPGNYSLIDNAYIYRNSNAHAWVEVYIDGYGWLMFDPTPGSTAGPAGSESRQVFRSVIDFLQDLFIIDPAGTQQLILSSLRDLLGFLLANPGISLLVLAVLAVLCAGIVALLRWPRRSGKHRFVPENDVVAGYLEIGASLARIGILPGPGTTARNYLAQAGNEHGHLVSPLEQFIEVYEQAAFSGRSPDSDSLVQTQNAVNQIRGFVVEELRSRKRR